MPPAEKKSDLRSEMCISLQAESKAPMASLSGGVAFTASLFVSK